MRKIIFILKFVLLLSTFSFAGNYWTLIQDTVPKVILVDSFGNVGIGINNPNAKLDVNGSLNITGKILLNFNPGDSGAVLISRGSGLSPVWEVKPSLDYWQQGTNKIFYNKNNVEIRKTFINKGDYSEYPNQTYFNQWLPNYNSADISPPFTFTGGIFPNNSPNQHIQNYVYNFGSNLNPGGGQIIDSLPAYGLGFENTFYIDNIPYNEFHILAVDKFGIRQRRPITCLFSYDGSIINMSHHLTKWNLHDKDNIKQIFSINTTDEIWDYNGNGLRHVFNATNYSPIWQRKTNGQAFPLIGYKNDNILLGEDTSNATLQIGQSILIGVDNFQFDYIGNRLGDGTKNFSIGTDTSRYNSIIINTYNEKILNLKNGPNPVGWSLTSNANGDLSFVDGNSNLPSFSISSNMPTNAFRMFANGNLCLNGTDQTERLVVNGNIKLYGSLITNNNAGNIGMVLTSNGSAQAPTWSNNISKRYEEHFVLVDNQTSVILQQSITPVSNNEIPIEVYVNGIKYRYETIASGTRRFTYSGNVIIFSDVSTGDEIDVVYFK